MAEPPSVADPSTLGYQALLQEYKKASVSRKAELLLAYGAALLSRYQHKLGAEFWTVMEQVLLGSLEYRQDEWTKWCLKKLQCRFSNSTRVLRLCGMARETVGDSSEALEIYTHILQERAEDMLTRKRIIALLRSRGRIAECLEHLNRHLEEFMSDMESWHEMAEVYIAECSLSRALFCFEELVCRDPRNIYNCITYAELCYSTGSLDLSRKYFCLALSLDGQSLRALWGLVLVNEEPLPLANGTSRNPQKAPKQLENVPKASSYAELTRMAVDTLIDIYKGNGASKGSDSPDLTLASAAINWLVRIRARCYDAAL